jgi:tetratricopeptide (TPR) repeat protein
MRSFHFASSEKKSHHAIVLRPRHSSATPQHATRFALRLIDFSAILAFFLLSPNVKAQDQIRGAQIVDDSQTTQEISAAQDRKDYALIFATDNYDHWPTLANPISDAEAIQHTLHDNYGFQAEVVKNPSRDDILTKLRQYQKIHYSDGDQLLIFFAGHGSYEEDDQQGYLVARETKSESDDPNRLTYESYDDLQAKLESIPVKHLLLVLDACFGGAFNRKITASRGGGDVYSDVPISELLGDQTKLTSRKYLTSGGKTYVSDGEPGQHSPFVRNFLQTLSSGGGSKHYLTFADIQAGVQATNPVPRAGDWGLTSSDGDFLFLSKALVPPPVTPLHKFPATTRYSIAVLDLQAVSGSSADSSIGASLSEGLTTDLPRGNLRPVAAEDVTTAINDLHLPTFSSYSQSTLAKIQNNLKANWVLSGSYRVQGTAPYRRIHVDLRVQDQSGDMITDGEDGAESDLSALIQKASDRLSEKLGVDVPVDERVNPPKPALTSDTEALEEYGEGIKKLQLYDLRSAQDSLQQAIKADPKFALAHAALSDALFQLGYDKQAQDEGKTAFDLSKNLSMEQNLIIEGSYLQKSAEWDHAIGIYKQLRDYDPHDRDYVLELAAVQTAGGKGQDALETLKQLRASDPDTSNDPRVDYQEAIASESLSNYKQEQSAAAAAAEKATKQGSRLLAAESYWQDCDAFFLLGDLKSAEEACRKANADADDTGQKQVKARSLTALSRVLAAEGETAEAMTQRQDVLQMAEDVGSQKDIVGALINLAMLQSTEGNLADAEKNEQEAVTIAKQIGDNQQLFDAENNLGANSQTEGDYQQAKASYEDALQSTRISGDQGGIAIALQNLGSVALQTGDLVVAERDVQQGLSASENAAAKSTTASGYGNLGDIQMVKGNLVEAQQSYETELRLFTEIGDQPDIAATKLSVAKLALEKGNVDQCQKLAGEALEEFQAEKIVDGEGDARNTIARSLIAQDKSADAQSQIAGAAKISVQDYETRMSLGITAARLKARAGKTEEARQYLDSALSQAKAKTLLGLQFDIRLAMAEIAGFSDTKARGSISTTLVSDAKTSGYTLVAARAERFSTTPVR